jgi:hypothetical protein
LYPLLDENGDRLVLVRKSTFRRWTFVVDRDEKIAYKNTKVKPLQDSEEVLAFIANMPKQWPLQFPLRGGRGSDVESLDGCGGEIPKFGA